jgi:hypothetical protein
MSIDQRLIEEPLRRAQDATRRWMERFPDTAKAELQTPATTQELTRLSYVDGYFRIKHTTPLILRVIGRLDGLHRRREAQFWIDHLSQEAFHDELMRRDLSGLLGGPKSAAAILRKSSITLPSAALLGYFDWQIANGNPSLLIALRLFLESFIAQLEDWRVAEVDALVKDGSRILLTHKTLDADHRAECLSYVSDFCGDCVAEVSWSIEFAGRCLAEAHACLAERLLRRDA